MPIPRISPYSESAATSSKRETVYGNLVNRIVLIFRLLAILLLSGVAVPTFLIAQGPPLPGGPATFVLETPRPGAVPQFPTFSENPTAQEITRARIFEEPLIPMWGEPPMEENKELAEALMAFASRTRRDDFSALESFLDSPIALNWYPSVLFCAGAEYYRAGYYSKAIAAWEETWLWGQDTTATQGRALADRAIGELVRMHARIGGFPRLKEILAEIEGRQLAGAAGEYVAAAKQAVWLMETRPEVAFRCGPLALRSVCSLIGSRSEADKVVSESASTTNGFSLSQLKGLSERMGLAMQLAKREPGAEIVVPCVVHWNVGHYAALVRADGDRYLAVDPTFGDARWFSREAIEAEASGFFVIPSAQLKAGWSTVRDDESRQIWGKGVTSGSDINNTSPRDLKTPRDCSSVGMAAPSAHLMLVSLNIEDTPLIFDTPIGGTLSFTVTYNQREASQPANYTYGNLGHKWTCNWLSYVKDDGTTNSAQVDYYVPGGGTEVFSLNTSSNAYGINSRIQAKLKPTSSTSYELTFPDGSRQVFGQPDGTVGGSRRIFLTQMIDPAGLTYLLNYDSSLRLATVVDTATLKTNLTFYYASGAFAGDTNVIRKVTDRYGRSAYFGYNGYSSKLETITDQLGLTSRVFYASTFINKLQTPYGEYKFSFGESGRSRWLETIDPLGGKSRIEYTEASDIGIPNFDPGDKVPRGMYTRNYVLYGRNTFYWDKKAMREAPGDYSKARLYHWLHDANLASAVGILESYKEPFENRVWFNYPGQADSFSATLPGTLNLPNRVGRVLDDGHTQLWQFYRNELGYVTNSIDPIGRNFTYIYSTNQVDLLEVRQTRAGNNELLAKLTWNSQHLPLSSTDAAGQTTRLVYNNLGQILFVTNALQHVTSFDYDAYTGRLLRIDGPLPGTNDSTFFTYDSFDRIRTVTDPDGYTITNSYDDLDRLTTVAFPDGTTETTTYKFLEPERFKDRAGGITDYVFNGIRQLKEIREATNWVTRFDWCLCGDLKSIIDPLGQTTRWFHDVQGRVTAKQFADGSRIEFGYETTTSRISTIKNERGQTRRYYYEYDDNLLAIQYADPQVTPNVIYTYDTNYNRLSSMDDAIGTTYFSYNPITSTPAIGAGALAAVSGPFSGVTSFYGYDALGRTVSEVVSNSQTRFYSYSVTRDEAGRIIGSSGPQGALNLAYTYQGTSDRLSAITFSGTPIVSYNYYAATGDFRLKDIVHSYGSGSPQFSYQYDFLGRIKEWSLGSPRFDAVGQLTNDGSYHYTFDLAGNRTSEKIGGNTVQTSYNPVNQPTGGYPSNSPTTQCEWDEENRLVAVTAEGRKTQLFYDGFGRWSLMRDVAGGSGPPDRLFIWTGDRPCVEIASSGASALSYNAYYPYGFYESYYGNIGFFQKDHLGSVRRAVSTSGAILQDMSYDPFGRMGYNYNYYSQTNANLRLGPNLGFGGLYKHPHQSFTFATFRPYDPNLGRWLSRDPIGEAGDINLYRFAANDPINYIDPDGLCAVRNQGPGGMSGNPAGPGNGGNRPPRPPSVASSAGASGGGEGGGWGPQRANGANSGPSRSNGNLIQEVATRSENAIGGTGRFAGTDKHSYAKRLLDKYQGIYGDRGLRTETTWLNHNQVTYGTKGASRIDVLDVNANRAYDYKFTINRPGLLPAQSQRIISHGPRGLGGVIEINP